MRGIAAKSRGQRDAEAAVDGFRRDLGPFVVAAEKTRMPMVFTDSRAPGNPIIFANAAFLALSGYERAEVLGNSLTELMAAGTEAEGHVALEAAFAEKCEEQPEIHCRRKDGSEFWASVFASPVCDPSGAVVQQFLSFVDLTRHREENARSKMLIDELNHRVKNTLSTVQSIVAQALHASAESAATQEAIESRILALSRSHDLLTSAKWDGAGLHDLVATALQPFEVVAGRSERFTIRGDNLRLPPKTTLSLAIALNELATNAVKYGAFSNEAGTIAIDWTVAPGVVGERLELRWEESGGPTVIPRSRKGFGSWVIERGLVHELAGEVELDFLPGGVVCTIGIPAPARNSG